MYPVNGPGLDPNIKAMMTNEVLTLNVGGVLYTTTRSTLTKYPNSMLGAMFNSRMAPTVTDSHGNLFIDRDGEVFKYVLNFLRSGCLCLPDDFKLYELLEAEADFYQILPLIDAIKDTRAQSGVKKGYYIEVLEFEETNSFYRFYTGKRPGQGKTGGLVISGDVDTLHTLPLPEKTLEELEQGTQQYRTVSVSSAACSKMALVHALNENGWQLLETSFVNNSDADGSYIVHKYLWFLNYHSLNIVRA